jgi:hypothetical protein
MLTKDYGENFREHLLKQYRSYVAIADDLSRRRTQTDLSYTFFLTAFSLFCLFIISIHSFDFVLNIVLIIVLCIGVLLCIDWYISINSYKHLQKNKFKVICELENELPFACYQREWKLSNEVENKTIRLADIRKHLPFFIGIPYLILIAYLLFQLF